MLNKEISKIIKSRKSVFPKDFNGQIISDDVVLELLKSANFAPSHKMTQPWHFKIFSRFSKNILLDEIFRINERITENKKNKLQANFEKTSHVICICMKRSKNLLPEWEEIASTAMAVQNLWMACVGSEIGGYWSTPKYIEKLNAFLGLREEDKCLGFFYLGAHKSTRSRDINRVRTNDK